LLNGAGGGIVLDYWRFNRLHSFCFANAKTDTHYNGFTETAFRFASALPKSAEPEKGFSSLPSKFILQEVNPKSGEGGIRVLFACVERQFRVLLQVFNFCKNTPASARSRNPQKADFHQHPYN